MQLIEIKTYANSLYNIILAPAPQI